MRRRLIAANVIVLLISLAISLVVSSVISRKNVKKSSTSMVKNYALSASASMKENKSFDHIWENRIKTSDYNTRLTYIRVISGSGFVENDSFLMEYDDKDYLEYEEFIEADQNVIVRYDDDMKCRMFYYVTKCNDNLYIRVGLSYDDMFAGTSELISLTVLASVVVFIVMALVISQIVIAGMRPFNKVITSLETLTTAEPKEYNYKDLKDVTEKINDVRDELAMNMQKLNYERNKIEIILENMGQGIVAIDSDFTISLINEFAALLLKVKENEAIGQNLFSIIDDDKLKDVVKRISDNNVHALYEKKDGDFYYSYTINLVEKPWGNSKKGIVIVISDVTSDRLAEARQKEFFNNASHELRSPLTSIVGFQELINEGFVSGDEVIDLVKRSLAEGKRMQNLINDMLNLASLESSTVITDKVNVSLKAIVDEITKSLEPQMLIDNLDCILNVKDVTVFAKQSHIYQMVRNVIDNAIKYNQLNGKIYIDVDEDDDYAKIVVKDTGVGISANDQVKIFERFYRVDKARSRALGSTGLGLSIVRQVCNLYKATLEIESKINQGTTITILFPKASI